MNFFPRDTAFSVSENIQRTSFSKVIANKMSVVMLTHFSRTAEIVYFRCKFTLSLPLCDHLATCGSRVRTKFDYNIIVLRISMEPPGQVVKLTQGADCTISWLREELRVRSPGGCCSETKILTRFFLQISNVDTWFRELVFLIAQGARQFHYSAQVWKEERLVSRSESTVPCRPRGLAIYHGIIAVAARGIVQQGSGRERANIN